MDPDKVHKLAEKLDLLPADKQQALLALLARDGIDVRAMTRITRRATSPGEADRLSFAQQRLWFLARLDGDGARDNIAIALCMRGDLDRRALIRALETIVARHEAVRARFIEIDGVPYQVFDEPGGFSVVEGDLGAEHEVRAVYEAEAAAPFDLAGPLIRMRLLRRAADDHLLLVTMHHAVADHGSVAVLRDELAQLYAAFCDGQPCPLPPPAIQYADFVHWQRHWLTGHALDQRVRYWEQQLAGLAPQVMVPADGPRPAARSYQGARELIALPAELVAGARQLSEQHGATLHMTLLAVFALVLHRYSRQTDLAIGTPVANRSRAEIAGLIGLFANTLAIRINLSGDPSFVELLSRIRRTALDAHAHQDVPFDRLSEALGLEHNASYSPLFQVMFHLDDAARTPALRGVAVSEVERELAFTRLALTLDLHEAAGGLRGAVEYNTDLFDRATIQRFVAHYTIALASVLADPSDTLSRFAILGDDERRQVVVEWNATARPYSQDRCLHEMFAAAARRHADRIAVESENRAWTYAELNARADRIACALRRRGVTRDAVVGLCMERAPEMVSGILGILKAGGAYLPIDPGYPAERIAYMIDNSGVDIVVTQPHLAVRARAKARQVMQLDLDGALWIGGDAVPDHPAGDLGGERPDAHSLAYVIYTSGSTGRPKGVMIEHRAAVNRIEWMHHEYGLDPSDVVLQKTPFGFDVSVWEFFWPLLTGARLLLAAPGGHKDPDYLISLIRSRGVTTLHFVPSMLRQVVAQAGWADCTSIRRVFCSGEALPGDLCVQHYARNPAALHNLYGPTEAAVDVSFWTVPRDRPITTVPIGKPIQNLRLYVLNEAHRPQPIGCAGELYIAGAGLARGYLNNPELTRERFVPDPFGPAPSDRMYRTGDLARWLPNGNLEFLGRIDDQVKIRGFRIELGEIEARLAQHPGVRSCVVIAREAASGDKQLVAYVVLGGELAGADYRRELIAHLESALPDYMIPGAFVALDGLPLNANGKLDRKALPAPGIDAYAPRPYVAPRTATERALVGAWAELLGFDAARISTSDNFFALGGHSLLITVLVARLKDSGLEATVPGVFAAPTLAHLAAELDAAAGPADRHVVPPRGIPDGCAHITPEMLPLVDLTAAQIAAIVETVPGGAPNVQDIYPLVPCQEGILFHHLIDPANDPYVIPVLLSVPDSDVCNRFVAALEAMIARHDALRTAVVTTGVLAPVQVVYRRAAVAVTHVALDPGEDAESQARAWVARPEPMALDRAPLLCLKVAADPHSPRHFVLFSAHHLIEDATSLQLMFDELMVHLAGRLEHLAPPAPYREFVAHTMHQLATTDAERFFRAKLHDVTESTTPFDLTDVHGGGLGLREVSRRLPEPLAREVRRHAQGLRISPATLFHAAWALVVSACSGLDDVVFGTVLSGRLQDLPGVERMLGNFINTLPLRVRLRDKTVQALVSELDTVLRELIAYEQSSLTEAQRCSSLANDAPLFSAVINFRHVESRTNGAARREEFGIRWIAALDRTNYPLALSIDDLGEAFSLTAQVEASIAPEAIVGYVEAAIAGIVGALAADGGARTLASSLDLLPPEERLMLVVGWNDTAKPYPHDRCVFELFEDHAARTPGAIALEYGDQRLTYAETNARANRIAHYLHGCGVGPDVRVGLCAERSLDLVIGLLGILKAGGAYVPMDPTHPVERVRSLLDSSGVSIVLSQSHLAVVGDRDHVIHLDTGERSGDGTQVLAGQPAHDLPVARTGVTPAHLAYVIFTSGSTGVPKGALIEHRGVVRTVCNPDWFPCSERSVVLHHATIAFDVGSQEVLGPLCNGGRLVIHDGDSRDISQLIDRIVRRGVNMMILAPVLLPAFAESVKAVPLPLEYLGIGGESFSAKDVRSLQRSQPRLTVINAYGPTENSVVSTCYVIPRDLPEDAIIPIGRPVAQSTAYVTDDSGRLVPRGVAGELCVGGPGVARGYLGNAALTEEQFVPDRFGGVPGGRLYRTGDRVRWLPDGNLVFLGRMDDQVKIRGFRVELGEIEAALLAHPAIRGAVVTTQATGEAKKLVAHVCPTAEYLDDHERGLDGDHIHHWTRLFEDQYAGSDAAAADLDLVGWNSSYTGAAVPEAEMRAWVEGTVQRIATLAPRRLLEIGCGTGLLLYRYAPSCEAVHALDISAVALAGIRREADRRGWSHVRLDQGDALSLDRLTGETFDTVILNSVVQYFPGRHYLDDVIARLLPHVSDGGAILIGDVRNADLWLAHLCAIERSRINEATAVATIASRVHRRSHQEAELLVSPSYFAQLAERYPEIGAVDILVKRGVGDNEMLSYRYDVVLTKGAAARPSHATLPWFDVASLAEVRAQLDRGHRRFGVAGVINPRIEDDVALWHGLSRWPGQQLVNPLARASRLSPAAVEQIHSLDALLDDTERRGYRCALTWSQDQAHCLDLLFSKDDLPCVQARTPYRQSYLANHPQIARVGPAVSNALRDHLSTRLPDYMVPSVFVVLESLPVTPNGKIDKHALPDPGDADVHQESYASPRTETERALCRLIQDVLDLERVGVEDNFFHLGGHSLLATRLVLRVKQELGKDLPASEILAGATVAQMAAAIDELGAAIDSAPLRSAAEARDEAPLSLLQQELWFLNRRDHLGASYDNVQSAHRVAGRLDRQSFAGCCRTLVERHAVLRTSYVERDGAIVQRVNRAGGFAVVVEHMPDERAVPEFLIAEQARPFHPLDRFMIRVHLLVVSDDEHVLVITRPWGVFDGWSATILVAELDVLYQAAIRGTAASLPELPVQYADFADWQRRAISGEELDRQVAYWRTQLAGLPPRVSLATDYQRCAVKSYRGAAVDVAIPADLRAQLEQLGQQRGVTLYMTLLSAFAVLLSGYTTDRDLAIGSPVTIRSRDELDRVVGYFVNVLVIRLALSPGHRFVDLLAQASRVTAEAHAHKDVPLGRVVAALVPASDPACSPLFQVMFNLVRLPAAAARDGSPLSLTPIRNELRVAKLDLSLALIETATGLHGVLEYSTDLFARRTIEATAARLDRLLRRIVAHPEAELVTLRDATMDLEATRRP